ncbi:MAG: IS4 family transposase, partial [Dysgonamonadaceae bacterium]|nr:IS4 family transposase [Dysgonamonadaceae bacterium]
MFENFCNLMITIARSKRSGRNDFFLDGNVYAFDSSTLSLCLNTFWWSRLHHDKGGVKLHTLLDVRTDVPAFNIITNANIHDSKVMYLIPYEANSYYVFDRAYMDTKQLYHIHERKSYFVVREKRKMKYSIVESREQGNPQTGIMADQRVLFEGNNPKKQYPEAIRRIVFYDKKGNRIFVFYSNNTLVKSEDIALLYKYRWRVELFYKWLKQHLRIKEFYGTSENAVKIQIYSAIITYCLVATVKYDLHLDMDTYDVLRILTVSLLDRTELKELLGQEKEKED